ncbi:MAG TPA: protein translocase subunit SecF [Bdellovibrionales bacterium]|nr:protein translocase subunit SecF [Bdellovibrionales bacterium]
MSTKQIQGDRKFDFVGKFHIYGTISVVAVLLSIASIAVFGLNYGIDFAGGTEVQVRFGQPVEVSSVRKFTEDLGFKQSQVQRFGAENEYLIRFENPQASTEREVSEQLKAMTDKVTAGLKSTFATQAPEVRRIDSVGPQVGSQLKRNSMLAAFYSLLLLLIYIGMRFDYKYAPGAIVCLAHDAILVVGIFAAMGKEVNIQLLAAVLTLIGFSLNDTIITFDRIRENEHVMKGRPMREIINHSVNDMLSRTILTSVTVFMTTAALYIFGTGVLKDFALAMSLGLVFGVYSSIYVAAPLVIVYERYVKGKTV